MQQSSSAADAKATSQALADAALAYLTPPADQVDLPQLPHNPVSAPIEAAPTGKTAAISVYTYQDDNLAAPASDERRIKSETETALPTLPSLLQYFDHILIKGTSRHNSLPYAGQACVICTIQWDKASTSSTLLPLLPCNDWVHYRCLIWLATSDGPHKDKCYACNVQLFEWDGISALTLATRTSLPMGNSLTTTLNPGGQPPVTSDKDVYEQECQFIDNTINRCFFNQLTKPSGFADNSPDLVQCFNGVLNDLRLMGRPQSKWLKWSTNTGSLLFGMLIAIKMRRFLSESHGRIKQTEAWIAWEDGFRSLQRKILDEIHKE